MGTHGSIVFEFSDEEKVYMYIHYDMYPQGMAARLYAYWRITGHKPYGEDYFVANFVAVLKLIKLQRCGFDAFFSGMGIVPRWNYIAVNYVYKIRPDGTITAYKVEDVFSNKKWVGEELVEIFDGSVWDFIDAYLTEENKQEIDRQIEKVREFFEFYKRRR